MNAPQRQIARITFERRHALQNPLWNARPRSTRQKRIAVYQVERKSEKRSGLKKNMQSGETGEKNRQTTARHRWRGIRLIFDKLFCLAVSLAVPFFIVFSRLSCFCLLFYFFFFYFVFFLIWNWLAEALEWDLFSVFVITTATIVGLNAAVWGNWIFPCI